MVPFDFLEGLDLTGDCWILTVRGSLRRALERELADRSLAGPGVLVLTLDEAVRRLAQSSLNPPLILERNEPVILAARLLEEHPDDLPYFRCFVAEGHRAVEGIAAPVAEALRRLSRVEGKIGAGVGRLADLIKLGELRRKKLASLHACEIAELYRYVTDLLLAGEISTPTSVVLCYPAIHGAVELGFLRALAQRCDLRIIYEDRAGYLIENLPSGRFIAQALRTLSTLGDVTYGHPPNAERFSLVSWLFNDGRRPERSGVGVHPWVAWDRRDEVIRVVREIKTRVLSPAGNGKEADLSSFQIVVPTLELYAVVLASELAARGIPFSMPAGEPLGATVPAQVLRALLDYLQHPGRAELHAYWGHPAVDPPRLPGPAEVREAFEELSPLLPAPPPGEDPRGFWFTRGVEGVLDPGTFDRLARYARITGLPRDWNPEMGLDERLKQSWLIPLCGYLGYKRPKDRAEQGEWRGWVEETRTRLFELAAMVAEEKGLDKLRRPETPIEELVAGIRDELRRRRVYENLVGRALSHLQLSTAKGDSLTSISERRRIEAVMRAWYELRGALDGVLRVTRFSERYLHRRLIGLAELRRLVESEIAARSVRVPGPDTGVAVYELRDTLGLPHGEVFLLGLTNNDFPPTRPPSLLPRELLEREPEPRDESVYLLSRLILRSRELWLSYPRNGLSGENRPAPPLADLLRLHREESLRRSPGGDPDLAPTCTTELAVVRPDHPNLPAPLRAAIGHGSAVMGRRGGEEPTAYDGLVSTALCRNLSPERNVTELEDYLACPRRFFLAHVMNLGRLPEVEDEVEANVIGRVAHRALEYFFAGRPARGGRGLEPWAGGEIGGENWTEACGRMLVAAEWAFIGEGLLPPGSIPSPGKQLVNGLVNAPAPLDAQRRDLVDGLTDPDSTAPAGVLRGALEIQRYAIHTLPASPDHLEYRFGYAGADPPLRLGDELVLRGRIDRVDYDGREGSLSIYDYKTGGGYPKPADVRNGRTVQLALYTLAALANIAGGSVQRIRGAVVALKNRHLSPDDPRYEHLAEGVLIEQVALRAKGNKVLDYSAAPGWLERAEGLALAAWEGIKAGEFHPAEGASDVHCRYCDFADLCGGGPFDRRIALAVTKVDEHA